MRETGHSSVARASASARKRSTSTVVSTACWWRSMRSRSATPCASRLRAGGSLPHVMASCRRRSRCRFNVASARERAAAHNPSAPGATGRRATSYAHSWRSASARRGDAQDATDSRSIRCVREPPRAARASPRRGRCAPPECAYEVRGGGPVASGALGLWSSGALRAEATVEPTARAPSATRIDVRKRSPRAKLEAHGVAERLRIERHQQQSRRP